MVAHHRRDMHQWVSVSCGHTMGKQTAFQWIGNGLNQNDFFWNDSLRQSFISQQQQFVLIHNCFPQKLFHFDMKSASWFCLIRWYCYQSFKYMWLLTPTNRHSIGSFARHVSVNFLPGTETWSKMLSNIVGASSSTYLINSKFITTKWSSD